MKKICFLFIAVLITSRSFTQNNNDSLLPKSVMEGTEVMQFKSVINQHDYVLYIKLPPSYNSDSTKQYPVLYILDAQWNFPLIMEISGGLLYDNLMIEPIFVGITWKGNPFANRNRDFTPTHTDFDSASGGASKFLKVIKQEIIAHIDSAYRTDKNNNALMGGSSAGLFVLYSLFQQPSPFNRFIANSPSLWYDDLLLLKMEKTFSSNNHILNAKLFLSSGGYEELNDPPMFKNFNAQLKASNYNGLEIESLVVDKTGHLSAGFYAITRALQCVFSKPELILDTALLNQYVGHYEHDLVITRTGNSLYINVNGNQAKMSAETDKRFYVIGVNGIGEFIKDENNKIKGLQATGADGNIFFKKLDE